MLLLAQTDDCKGERLGDALDDLMDLGARNVQLLSSLTKKGRPGHTLLIDTEPEYETAVAAYLAAELGVWGYHVLESAHRHFDVQAELRHIVVHVANGSEPQSLEAPVQVKVFGRNGDLLRVKVDHDDVRPIHDFLADAGRAVPFDVVRGEIEAAVWREPASLRLEITW